MFSTFKTLVIKDRIPTYIVNTMSRKLVIRMKKIRGLLVDPITNSPN